MKRFLNASFLTLLALGLSQPALARGPGGGRGGMWKAALEKLGLSAEQKDKIKAIRKSRESANKETREALKEARKSMEEAVKGDASKSDLLAKFESLQTLRNKMGRQRFDMILEVREVLTPEQRKNFRSMLEQHHGLNKEPSGEKQEE